MGRVTREQVVEALDHQKRHGGKLGEVLINLGFVSREDIEFALAAQRGEETAVPTVAAAAPAPAAPLPAQQLVEAFREFGTSVIGLEEVPEDSAPEPERIPERSPT